MTKQQQDLVLIAKAYASELEWMDDYGYGAPGISQKRPFGNSDVEGDLLDIIGAKPEGEDGNWSIEQYAYVRELYVEKLIPFLKQLVQQIPAP